MSDYWDHPEYQAMQDALEAQIVRHERAIGFYVSERNKLYADNERLRAVCEMALKDQHGWPNRMREVLNK